MHVHALNISCTPHLHSYLNVSLLLFPLLFVRIVVSGLRCFHYCLIIIIPFLNDGIVVQNFIPSYDTPSLVFHWTCILWICYNILKSTVKRLLEFCYSYLASFIAHKITYTFINRCTCHHHQTFPRSVLNFFHHFLRIISTVNFMNERIVSMIVSPPALVQL